MNRAAKLRVTIEVPIAWTDEKPGQVLYGHATRAELGIVARGLAASIGEVELPQTAIPHGWVGPLSGMIGQVVTGKKKT